MTVPAADARRVARSIRIRGAVQGVGFRPYVYRLACAHSLAGWVLNGDAGVWIHVEGAADRVDAFVAELTSNPPPAARIADVEVEPADAGTASAFEIRASDPHHRPTTRILPDLATCAACLRELFDPTDRRWRYPYINCTNCGPRFSIVFALPYDRATTTMAGWPLCPDCDGEYRDPADRRFHAQPVACPDCGPRYHLLPERVADDGETNAICAAARQLREGRIVAAKGLGGYHLVCDADNQGAVTALRTRKFRKEQAFAIMVRDLDVARRTVHLTDESISLMTSPARPIVLAPALAPIPEVAPDNRDLGVMLPYAPVHHLLFEAGAPDRLVMTSGNRSSEPIAYADTDAIARLSGIADCFLAGERPIARRVDDSVVRAGALGPVVLRRARGLAPDAVATLPAGAPILAVGADLKNSVTLVVDGQAYVSQHVGDLSQLAARNAFQETIRDLLTMYEVGASSLTVVHDAHPEYASTASASRLAAARKIAVQHHRAHVASVLAERGALERRVVGVTFDGTGYGDDGSIWGGEFFVGSVSEGFDRVASLRPARLAGGDAAARLPVQAAAGYLAQLDRQLDFASEPFNFPRQFLQATSMLRSGLRVFSTTSAGRLFDAVAALLGFTRPITFEGQAAMWLEHLARGADRIDRRFPCPFDGSELDWRDTLAAVVEARCRGVPCEAIARAFHRSLARGTVEAAARIAAACGVDAVVLSGGVMQNDLLLADIRDFFRETRLEVWTNRAVPSNDGGISLGQAALACVNQDTI